MHNSIIDQDIVLLNLALNADLYYHEQLQFHYHVEKRQLLLKMHDRIKLFLEDSFVNNRCENEA